MLAYIQELVENERELLYEVVIAELDRLYDSVGDVLPFRIYARLVIALKILVICCQKLFFRYFNYEFEQSFICSIIRVMVECLNDNEIVVT